MGCVHNHEGCSRPQLFLIAIAGPAASLLSAVVTLLLWHRTGGLVRDACYTVSFLGVGFAGFTLLPLSLKENRKPGSPLITLDGYHALAALLPRFLRTERDRS